MLPNFTIQPGQPASDLFIEHGITRFHDAVEFIHNLTFKRNSDKDNVLIVLKEKRGTCGTKHALLAQLAAENNYPEIQLTLGIFKMNAENSPKVASVLKKYNFDYIPEAHNYLVYNGKRYDITFPGNEPFNFEPALIQEMMIQPHQVGNHKVALHKKALAQWIEDEKLPLGVDELFSIREECSAALASN